MELDWCEVAARLRHLELRINEFRVFSRREWLNDIDKTASEVRLPETITDGIEYIAAEIHQRELLAEIAYDFGLASAKEIQRQEEIPDHIQRLSRPAIEIVRECIEARAASTEFVLGWGRLNFLAGKFSMFLLEHPRNERRELQGGRGFASESKLDQRLFYAAWCRRHGRGLKPSAHKHSDSMLVELCEDLVAGSRLPPNGWEADWFGALVQTDPDGNSYELRSTYQRLTREKLEDLLKQLDEKKRSIPSLELKSYPKKCRP